jgi:hypothetical protein
MAIWQNRIIGTGIESPDQLLANPNNFRIHPKYQQDALSAVLDEVGWVDDVIVNKTTGHIIDGHLRVELALSKGESEIPVKYVELSENEEKLILSVFDPISAMAVQDKEKLEELLAGIESDNEGIKSLIAGIEKQCGDEIEWNGGDPLNLSPWDRVTDAGDGIMFSFGEIQKRLPIEIFEKFKKNVNINNLEAWLNENLHI